MIENVCLGLYIELRPLIEVRTINEEVLVGKLNLGRPY